EVGQAQVALLQAGAGQVGTGESGLLQVGQVQGAVAQVGTGQVGAGQVHAAHVLVAQVGTAQIGAGAVAARLDAAAVDHQHIVVGEGIAAGQQQGGGKDQVQVLHGVLPGCGVAPLDGGRKKAEARGTLRAAGLRVPLSGWRSCPSSAA